MVGLVPTIHVFIDAALKTWMLATRASMTAEPYSAASASAFAASPFFSTRRTENTESS